VARFDFNYHQPLGDLQRREIQGLLNQHVLDDLEVSWRVMGLEEARAIGALMIFGEKYGEDVRVVSMGNVSRELCGGTHVHHSSEVGPAVLLSETGIGSGLRRVTVVAGQRGLSEIYRRLQDLREVSARLNVPLDQAKRRVDELLEQLDEARREIQRLSSQLAAQRADDLAAGLQQVAGVSVLATRVEAASVQALTEQWDALRERLKNTVVFLGAPTGGRTSLLVGVTPDLRARGLDASVLMRQFARLAGGKGGGNPTLAKGAGGDPALLSRALEEAPRLVREALNGG
jgi:alanyl-tRNA synthetase